MPSAANAIASTSCLRTSAPSWRSYANVSSPSAPLAIDSARWMAVRVVAPRSRPERVHPASPRPSSLSRAAKCAQWRSQGQRWQSPETTPATAGHGRQRRSESLLRPLHRQARRRRRDRGRPAMQAEGGEPAPRWSAGRPPTPRLRCRSEGEASRRPVSRESAKARRSARGSLPGLPLRPEPALAADAASHARRARTGAHWYQ